MEASVASTCSRVEMEAMNSEMAGMESRDHDSAEAIAGQNKRITSTVLKQEIADLKSQLQNSQRQITNPMEKQFALENF